MDFIMLITAYGKLGDFNGAERVLGLMNKNGYAPNVVSQTAPNVDVDNQQGWWFFEKQFAVRHNKMSCSLLLIDND